MSSITSTISQHSSQLLILGLGAALGFAISKTCCSKKCQRSTTCTADSATATTTTTPTTTTTTPTVASTSTPSKKGPIVDYSKKSKEEIETEFKNIFDELKQ